MATTWKHSATIGKTESQLQRSGQNWQGRVTSRNVTSRQVRQSGKVRSSYSKVWLSQGGSNQNLGQITLRKQARAISSTEEGTGANILRGFEGWPGWLSQSFAEQQ